MEIHLRFIRNISPSVVMANGGVATVETSLPVHVAAEDNIAADDSA